jgi:hypothetical protein
MAVECGELAKPEDEFRIGETVTVQIDWGDGFHRNKRFQITGFQTNGHVKSAKGFWKGKYAKKLTEDYGTIFPLLDLKKIS